jgi:hypothetical protein
VLISVHPKDYKIKEAHKINAKVEHIKLTGSYLLAFSDNLITVFHKVQDRFFEQKPYTEPKNFLSPVSVLPTNDERFVLFNEEQNMYLVQFVRFSQVDVN